MHSSPVHFMHRKKSSFNAHSLHIFSLSTMRIFGHSKCRPFLMKPVQCLFPIFMFKFSSKSFIFVTLSSSRAKRKGSPATPLVSHLYFISCIEITLKAFRIFLLLHERFLEKYHKECQRVFSFPDTFFYISSLQPFSATPSYTCPAREILSMVN